MSHGPGKWQRRILEAMEGGEEILLDSLLPFPEGTKPSGLYEVYGARWLSRACSDESALLRASRILEQKGLINRVRRKRRIVRGPYDVRWKAEYLISKCSMTAANT
jgi:hypothetical protein